MSRVGPVRAAVGAACIALALGAGACAWSYAHHVSGVGAGRGPRVRVRDAGWSVLHLWTPRLDAAPLLVRECGSAAVTGVETDAVVREFLLVQRYEVTATAYCAP